MFGFSASISVFSIYNIPNYLPVGNCKGYIKTDYNVNLAFWKIKIAMGKTRLNKILVHLSFIKILKCKTSDLCDPEPPF